MEEGNDVKWRAVTNPLKLVDVVEPMEEGNNGNDVEWRAVTSWLKPVDVV